MTWPSFFAAAIKVGVTGSGGGASAITRVENVVPTSTPPAALSMVRRDNPCFFIGPFCRVSLTFGTPEIVIYSCNKPGVCRRRSRSLQLDLTVRRESWIWPATGPHKQVRGRGDRDERPEIRPLKAHQVEARLP